MSLSLSTLERLEGGFIRATYEVKHSTPGAHGTTLSEPMSLFITPHQTKATLNIPDCDAKTPEEAIARMSAWLRRLADGVDEHKTSINLPL